MFRHPVLRLLAHLSKVALHFRRGLRARVLKCQVEPPVQCSIDEPRSDEWKDMPACDILSFDILLFRVVGLRRANLVSDKHSGSLPLIPWVGYEWLSPNVSAVASLLKTDIRAE